MKKRNKLLFIGILTYSLVIIGFIVLCIFVGRGNDKRVIFDGVPTDSRDEKSNSFNVSLQSPVDKRWVDGLSCGSQHEIIYKNTFVYELRDWEFVLTVDKSSKIDSSWEADFTLTDNPDDPSTKLITVKSLGQSSIILNDDNWHKFGCVIKANTFTPILHVTATATRHMVISESPVFWILIFFSICLIFITCVQLALIYKTKQYQAQRVRDEAIIVQSINTFVNFIDAKDPYTKGHSTRVASYSRELGVRLKLSEEEQKNLYFIALMHDVGKVSIPDSVLQKPGKLTPEERKVIESHTTIGGDMLRAFTAIPGIVSGALYHHERYDGTGYPQGLRGNQIPQFARIICVADSFDAMSSRRCYRSKLSYDEIVAELANNSGKQFDPDVCKAMLDLLSEAKNSSTLERFNL